MDFLEVVSEAADAVQNRLAAAAICITVLLSTLILFMKIHRINNRSAEKLPPGPPGLPIIGHLHMLGKLPHRKLCLLSRRYGPLMSLRLGSVPTVIVSSAEMAQQFLKNHDHVFSSRPTMRCGKNLFYNSVDMIFSPYGQYWKQVRRISVSELLSTKSLEALRFQREEEVSVMIHSLLEKCARVSNPVVDVSKTVLAVAVDIICRMAFGRKYSDEEAYDNRGFEEMIKEFGFLLGAFDIGDFIPYLGWMDLQGLGRRQKAISRTADAFYEKLIEEHLAQKDVRETRDFVDVLLALSEHNIRRDNIKAILIDMLHAGSDAPSTALEWAMSELLRRPLVMTKAQEELEKVVGLNRKVRESDLPHLPYLQAVVKETLRLYPSAPLLAPHESMESCTVCDYEIPARTRVIVNAWAIGRDPKSWEDAEEFKPERFTESPSSCVDVRGQDFELIPFGSGRRGCPGMQLGMVIVEFVLAQLLHCFDWRLPAEIQGRDLDMTENFGLAIPRAVPLLAIPTPRLAAEALGSSQDQGIK
jgi:cytochrome P450